jgi:hypothetical protein
MKEHRKILAEDAMNPARSHLDYGIPDNDEDKFEEEFKAMIKTVTGKDPSRFEFASEKTGVVEIEVGEYTLQADLFKDSDNKWHCYSWSLSDSLGESHGELSCNYGDVEDAKERLIEALSQIENGQVRPSEPEIPQGETPNLLGE